MKYGIMLLFAAVSFAGCKGQETPTNKPNVYVAGLIGKVAILWKNGIAQSLTDGSTDAVASSVFVSGSDVYATGWKRSGQNSKTVAILWKNGVAKNLTSGKTEAAANSVFVSGGNVYVSGYEENAKGIRVATLWKNGIAESLTNENLTVVSSIYGSTGDVFADAQSVFVSGSDVYVAGYEYNTAKVWKNGAVQDLTDGENGTAQANSVYVSGSDEYVVGYDGDTAKLWKNGIAQNLTDGKTEAEATSIFVYSKNIYIVGREKDEQGRFVAKLWKDGIMQNFSGERTNEWVNSVYVFGGDIYVAGFDEKGAKLWKNGVAQNLTGGKRNAEAYSVFVSNSAGNTQAVYAADNTRQSSDTVIVVSDKTYFHNQPNEETVRKGYLQKGDKAAYSSESNGYLYVTFTSNLGQTSTGWINKKDVEIDNSEQ